MALSTASEFKDIHPWTKYPGSNTHMSGHCEKAVSLMAYAHENPDLQSDARAYQVEPDMKSYIWTKLLLNHSALPSGYDDISLRKAAGENLMCLPRGKTVKDVVADYLRGVRTMFDQAVQKKLGDGRLDDLPIDSWLTVPATWIEHAKILTKEAALAAGFASRSTDNIFLIPEPEAAAHLALKSSIHQVDDLLRPGSGVMICDCGGGTVDSTTYDIQQASPLLKMKETCIGVGGKCGGTFVDRNLYKLLSARFGADFTSLGPEQIGPGSRFMDIFEQKKRGFSGSSPGTKPKRLFLPMPMLESHAPGMSKHYDKLFSSVLLSDADMRAVFGPMIEVVLRLVHGQVEQEQVTHTSPVVPWN